LSSTSKAQSSQSSTIKPIYSKPLAVCKAVSNTADGFADCQRYTGARLANWSARNFQRCLRHRQTTDPCYISPIRKPSVDEQNTSDLQVFKILDKLRPTVMIKAIVFQPGSNDLEPPRSTNPSLNFSMFPLPPQPSPMKGNKQESYPHPRTLTASSTLSYDRFP